MPQPTDPFDAVKQWWGNKSVPADISKMGINLDSQQGAFECFILAILYTIEDSGELAERTFMALQKQGLTSLRLLSSTTRNSPEWNRIIATFEQHYRGRQKNRKTKYITEGARLILQDTQLKGDLRRLHLACAGDERRMLKQLWKFKGLKKKAFWIMREMRMQGVWRIDGGYCCVPDKQVGSSLERWGKIRGWKQNQGRLHFLMNCSDIVWQAFGELYDFPILDYARIFKCNYQRSRKCQQCGIVVCNARSTHVIFVTDEVDDKRGEKMEYNEISPAGKAIVEAKNHPTDGMTRPRREINISPGWTTCLVCKGGPLDLSIVRSDYGACVSQKRGKQPYWWIPVKVWIGATKYDGRLRCGLEKNIGACIANRLNDGRCKLGDVMTAAGFAANEKVHLKFTGNEVWVLKIC